MSVTSLRVEREIVYPDSVWVLVSVEATPLQAKSWGCAPLDAGGVAKALVCANDDAVRKAIAKLYSSNPQDSVTPPETSTNYRRSVSLDIQNDQQRNRVPLSRHPAWLAATKGATPDATGGRRVSESAAWGVPSGVSLTSDQDAARRARVSKRISLHPAWKSTSSFTLEKPSAAVPRGTDSQRISLHPAWKSTSSSTLEKPSAAVPRGSDSQRISLHPAWKSAGSFTLERPSVVRVLPGSDSQRSLLHSASKSTTGLSDEGKSFRSDSASSIQSEASAAVPRGTDSQRVSLHPAWKSAGSFTLERPSDDWKSFRSDSASSIQLERLDIDDASVKIPISCPKPPARATKMQTKMQSLERVLIVDADAVNLKVMKRILHRRGAKVTCGEDGLEVIEQCITWNKRFDLIIVDEHMRYMTVTSAISVLRKYEQEHGLPKTPVIVTTASLHPRNMLNYSLCGIDGVLAKPVNMRQLPDMLDAYASHLQMKGSLSPIEEDGNTGTDGIKKHRSPLFETSTMFGDLEIFGELNDETCKNAFLIADA